MSEQEIINKAYELFKAGSYAEAIPYYQKAVEIRKKYQQASGLAMDLMELGTCYYYAQKIQECFQAKIDSTMVFLQIHANDQQDKYLENIMKNFRFVGDVAYRVRASNIFKQMFDKILEELKKLNDNYGLLLTYRSAIPT
ncbi:MAG: hypothetical protein GF383_02355, partial [Candidatus Lokiarchaeota archaeon]|nr:hypothetical protein [Candidatus Lokiarchaeota archaeon]MBD3338251.1 hypothetical protein [Candidatus Lokiarchaeota archaeon]